MKLYKGVTSVKGLSYKSVLQKNIRQLMILRVDNGDIIFGQRQ